MPDISSTFVNKVTEPGMYKDDKLTGFHLKVTPTGAKIYLVYGKVRGSSKPVKVTIGKHGEPDANGKSWTPPRARQEAERIRGVMLKGINPNEERTRLVVERQLAKDILAAKEKREQLTLRTVFGDYIASKKLKPNTAYGYQCDLFKCLHDWLDEPILSITEDMIEARHKLISAEHLGQANTVMRILRALFNYAAIKYLGENDSPIITKNPVKRLSQVSGWNRLKRRRTLIKDHQLESWYAGVYMLRDDSVRDYLFFLLLTGLRKMEAAKLKWSDVDMKTKTFLVRDTKNKEDHELPMSTLIYELMLRRSSQRENDYVFAGSGRHEYIADCSRQLVLVTEKSKVQFTLHDIRRTFLTAAESLDISYHAVKRLGNHKMAADVTSGYIVSDVERLRAPMQRITDHFALKIGLQASEDENKVLHMKAIGV